MFTQELLAQSIDSTEIITRILIVAATAKDLSGKHKLLEQFTDSVKNKLSCTSRKTKTQIDLNKIYFRKQSRATVRQSKTIPTAKSNNRRVIYQNTRVNAKLAPST